jgi:hypothetical protein
MPVEALKDHLADLAAGGRPGIADCSRLPIDGRRSRGHRPIQRVEVARALATSSAESTSESAASPNPMALEICSERPGPE